jgi:hypothetical protein
MPADGRAIAFTARRPDQIRVVRGAPISDTGKTQHGRDLGAERATGAILCVSGKHEIRRSGAAHEPPGQNEPPPGASRDCWAAVLFSRYPN